MNIEMNDNLTDPVSTSIYVASSWRNVEQPHVVTALREAGFDAYDFRHPTTEDHGFSWSSIDPAWKSWKSLEIREGLRHPIASRAYQFDKDAMERADIGVLVAPCGNDAHNEIGWLAGRGKPCAIYLPRNYQHTASLMYLLQDGQIVDTVEDLVAWVKSVPVGLAQVLNG